MWHVRPLTAVVGLIMCCACASVPRTPATLYLPADRPLFQGSYPAGTTLHLVADPSPVNLKFTKWEVENLAIADLTQAHPIATVQTTGPITIRAFYSTYQMLPDVRPPILPDVLEDLPR